MEFQAIEVVVVRGGDEAEIREWDVVENLRRRYGDGVWRMTANVPNDRARTRSVTYRRESPPLAGRDLERTLRRLAMNLERACRARGERVIEAMNLERACRARGERVIEAPAVVAANHHHTIELAIGRRLTADERVLFEREFVAAAEAARG